LARVILSVRWHLVRWSRFKVVLNIFDLILNSTYTIIGVLITQFRQP